LPGQIVSDEMSLASATAPAIAIRFQKESFQGSGRSCVPHAIRTPPRPQPRIHTSSGLGIIHADGLLLKWNEIMATAERPSSIGEPTWEIAHLFPEQGTWSEDEYLDLDTSRRIEFVDGRLEFPPMPTELHQLIVGFLYRALYDFAVTEYQLGTVLFSGLRVKLWEGRIREPDVVFMFAENKGRRGNKFWQGADLAMEVVSEDDPDRDWFKKREEYAKAGIREYWIVDPRAESITVFFLDESGRAYTEIGEFKSGDRAASKLIDGFSIDVAEVFSQT